MVKEKKQTAWYARWPLAARAINTTSHHLITSDVTEKYKKHMQHSSVPGGPSDRWAPVICTGLRLPPLICNRGQKMYRFPSESRLAVGLCSVDTSSKTAGAWS